MHFEIYRTNNEYAFQLLDENNQLMLTSGLYPTVEACIEGVRLFAEAAVNADTYTLLSDDTTCSFVVQSKGKQLAQSIGYPSEEDAKEVAELLRDELADTTQYEVQYTEVRTQAVQRPGLVVDIDSYDFSRASTSGQMGFETFQHPDSDLYYFHFNDGVGKAFLYSQAYAAENTRDNGIRSVIQNALKDNQYEIQEAKGTYYFILKAVNGREIARSRMFDTRNEMENSILLLKTQVGSFAEQYKKPEKVRTRGGNPPIDKYNFDRPSQSGMEGFELLQDETTRQHYFHFNNDRAEAILYSQGYNNLSGRDNGIRSVIKNAYLEERYQRMQQQGQYYFILKAGNNQEIARSPLFETAADMEIAIQYLKTHTSAYAPTYQVELRTEETHSTESRTFQVQVNRLEPLTVSASGRQIDQYDFTQKSSTGKPGFEPFYSEQNQAYYFHFNDEQGNAILYSESYPNDIVRDNGIESVRKNAPQENRWKMVEENGRYYYTLKAGNNQEIARGPLFESQALAQAKLAFIQTNSTIQPLAPSSALPEATPLMTAGAVAALSVENHTLAPVVATPPVAQPVAFGPIPSDAGAIYIDPLRAIPGSTPLQKFIITSLPLAAQGLLFLHEKPLEKFQEISIEDSSQLQFQPNEDTTGDIFFRYKVIDHANVHSEEADYRIRVERAHVPVAAYAPPIASHTLPGAAYAASTQESGRTGWLIAAVAIAAIALVGYWWNTRVPQPNEIVPQGNKTERSTPAAPVAASVSAAVPAAATLENFRPIRLYFNNDHPNPRTEAETTPLTYTETYQTYYPEKERFAQEYAKGLSAAELPHAEQLVADFFDSKVKKGHDDLLALSDTLLEKLKEGYTVEITVTGYASPLASNDYNRKLTSRRVHCIENHFRTYQNGQFMPYLEKGKLLVTENLSGEETARPTVSDQQTDTRSSLYSPDASAERRVEITNVTLRKPE